MLGGAGDFPYGRILLRNRHLPLHSTLIVMKEGPANNRLLLTFRGKRATGRPRALPERMLPPIAVQAFRIKSDTAEAAG